jgi:hypothetical protein
MRSEASEPMSGMSSASKDWRPGACRREAGGLNVAQWLEGKNNGTGRQLETVIALLCFASAKIQMLQLAPRVRENIDSQVVQSAPLAFEYPAARDDLSKVRLIRNAPEEMDMSERLVDEYGRCRGRARSSRDEPALRYGRNAAKRLGP